MNADQEQRQLLPLLSFSSFQQTQHQQQQQIPQQQQQQKSSLARMSSGEYVNFNSLNTTIATNSIEPTLSLSTSLSSTSLVGLTAMTISRDLPIPPMSDNLIETTTSLIPTMTKPTTAAAVAGTTTPTTTTNFETMGVMTSSFKTPLLPMPTLEDIEGVVYEQQQQQPQQHQIHHHQQHSHHHYEQQQQQITTRGSESAAHIPIGILKYPTTKSPPICQMPTIKATGTITPRNTTELNLSLSFADAACSTSTTLVSHDAMPTSTSPPTTIEIDGPNATIGAVRHKYMNINTTSSTAEIPASDVYAADTKQVTTTTTTTAATKIASTTLNASTQNLRLKSTSTPSKPPTTTTTTTKLPERSNNSNSNAVCCFCCFARKRNDANASPSDAKARKSKQKTQTLWSAFITNVGICALLLAYTFLGAFIFLTIEGEDLYQQQHTLASTTKRFNANGGRVFSVGGRQNINSDNTGVGHVYGTKLQKLNNNNHNSYNNNAGNSTLTLANSPGSTASVLEAVVMTMNGNGETVYGWDGKKKTDEDDDSDEINTPQSALSAETSDVRQRTIENIWDITVSLNILYKENWTKLAALEIAKFQDQLVKRLNEDAMLHYYAHDGLTTGAISNQHSPATEAVLLHTHTHQLHHEWNFAKAFFYALTILTTIGYGHIAPRSTLSRLVTLVYALFGIPLTLVYLSSTGGILAKVAREVFSKALCCCLCSNCGYCCYDEKRMAEKERRMKRKRQLEELRKQQAAMQEPYYVRSGSGVDNFQLPTNDKQEISTPTLVPISEIDSLSVSESHGSMHGLSILAPILLCLSMMVIYIAFGALVLYRLENWPIIDGVYFCFMSLSTIGFGDMLPGLRRESNTTTWFCSIYIMCGMALTAMCFNVIHDEIVHRIKIVVEFKNTDLPLDSSHEQPNYYVPP